MIGKMYRFELCILALLAAGTAVAEENVQQIRLIVAAQPIATAINELSRQSGLRIVIDSRTARGVTSTAVDGEFTTEGALTKLLENTGLSYTFLGKDAVAVVKAKKEGERISADQNSASDAVGVRMAQTGSPAAAQAERQDEARKTNIEEIIVTAQKRAERLQDVPVPVSSIDADSLVDNNQLRLQDYYTKTPSLNLVVGVRGDPQLSIRGLSSGLGTIPTVGVTIDDVPYGPSVALTGGFSTPDLDPSDLARIEILRGPQGTLYGANSIGGLLKFVTVDPSTEKMSGRVEVGTNDVHNGSKPGYSIRGAMNAPLSDTVAMRVSGFKRRHAGYIDNIVNGAEGTNEILVEGGRLSGLWRPSQDFSLKLSALGQQSERGGSVFANLGPGLADLQQNAARNTGSLKRKFQAYSAIANADLEAVDVVSVSGYNVSEQGISAQAGPNAIFENLATKKFTQEVRLSAPIGARFEWLAGGFYTREKTAGVQDTKTLNPATGAPIVTLRADRFPATYEEYSVFADLTYKAGERFDIQMGGRATQNEQTFSRISTGPNAPNPAILTERRLQDDSFTYLVTPRFRLTPDVMLYARFASGYRPGSLNSGLETLPLTYTADTTLNYEVGIKGQAFNRVLSYEASVYYIDWKDIQVLVVPPPPTVGNYFDNVGSAKSQGVELSVDLQPLEGLTITAWTAYNDATLTEDFPPGPAAGTSGERLPFSASWSGNLSINLNFPLPAGVAGFAGAGVSYVGDREGNFVATVFNRQSFPAYSQVDLHAGAEFNAWRVNLYANNIADKRGAVTGDPTVIPSGIVYIQPRTVGLSLTRGF